MKIGKISGSILDRSVAKVLHRNSDSMLCKLKPGIGYQLVHMGKECLMASAVNTVEGTPDQVGAMLVPRGLNALACSGALPKGIMLTLTLPETVEEPDFRKLMQAIDQDCQREHIEVLGGHTQVSSGVSRVIASVTAVGICPALKKEGDGAAPGGSMAAAGQMRPVAGQDIVMTKWAGLSGTWLIHQQCRQAFIEKYNRDLSDAIEHMKEFFCVCREAAVARDFGVQYMLDLSVTGVFGGLWEAASAGNVGLCVELKHIPIRQETVELCDFVDVNPYLIPSMGAMLMASWHGSALVSRLKRAGIEAAVIGNFTQGNDRVIVNEDEVRYLDMPRASIMEGIRMP